LKIIDPHHHLWDLETNHYPWLVDPIDNFAGDYASIRKTYLITDLIHETNKYELVKSVHVQAEFDHDDDPVKETAWLQSVANDPDARGMPNAIVGYADLTDPKVESVLARHSEHPNIRGIRDMLNFSDDPILRLARRGDLMTNPEWLGGIRLLAKYGLSFDLQVWPWQLLASAKLAKSIPEVQIILNHTGMPLRRESDDLKEWRSGLVDLAKAPNVSAKISALVMFDQKWTVESLQPFVLDTIDILGSDRCMFASNFPVDKQWTEYDQLWTAYEEITSAFTVDERKGLFHDNAERLYRI